MQRDTDEYRKIGELLMEKEKQRTRRKIALFAAIFLLVNVLSFVWVGKREIDAVDRSLSAHATETQTRFDAVMDNYKRSFQLFAQMMAREIARTPDPDAIWTYLKSVDQPLLEVEGETFDGLYMYYQGRYLYSWDTPYAQYADTGYVATERPWYQAAVAGGGSIVFTPPYMSYANHYILTTISQLQPDGETVFAYDIKMGDIQALVSAVNRFPGEQVLIFDSNGTIIGSTDADYLGGDLDASVEETAQAADEAAAALAAAGTADTQAYAKLEDQAHSAQAFHTFRTQFGADLDALRAADGRAARISIDGRQYCGLLHTRGGFGFLILVPVTAALQETVGVWLVPLLLIELLLIYILSRVSKEQKNRELRAAYVELGQIQKRLQIALSAAQKAAAIDDLTGMMNFKSFRKGVTEALDAMGPDDHGILIMIDGDRFKQVNDTYGHNVGDEVIKLSAQMIIGRIRTVDLASRLHGDEFAIFVADTADYTVAQRIMEDINKTIAREAGKRNVPAITLSAGAVIAGYGDHYTELAKAADEALYVAKETHNGQFAQAE